MRANPILFTPGPVRIPPAVARALADPPCNYHRQDAFSAMFGETEADLKTLAGIREPAAYFATILTATGTGANEACLQALAGAGKGLILRNGFFAARLVNQVVQAAIPHTVLDGPHDAPFDAAAVNEAFRRDPELRWLYFVSHETRAGLKNPMVELGRAAKRHGALVGADIVSSAYAYPIDIEAAQLDVAVTSSAKAIQGAPGLGIVFVKHDAAGQLGRGRSYYLDLVGEYDKQRRERQPRFAQPVALHAALHAACGHLRAVGMDNHFGRIQRQMDQVADFLATVDVRPLLDRARSSWIAVNFRLPSGHAYPEFARRMVEEGFYVLYGIPGDASHFQVSTIGDLSDEQVGSLNQTLGRVLGEKGG